MKFLVLKIIYVINRILYPDYDVKNSVHPQLIIFKMGFFQKILGFNRHVPWPVHWTSTINAPGNIVPGTRTPGLGKGCNIDGRNGIILEENVWIGPGVSLVSMNHDVLNYHNYVKTEPIIIKKNSWIATNAIVLAGVELGEHTVVAAGAIVTKSFPEGNQVLAGNPAKVVKKLGEYNSGHE
ncbi:acyltransferase [Thiomicrolovo sp. ZZH C-3]